MLAPMPLPTSGKSFNGQATLDDGPQNQETLKVDQRWTTAGRRPACMRHQHTKEPGSAFYGPHGTVPGDPGASLLFRTVDFFALNNIFVPTPTRRSPCATATTASRTSAATTPSSMPRRSASRRASWTR